MWPLLEHLVFPLRPVLQGYLEVREVVEALAAVPPAAQAIQLLSCGDSPGYLACQETSYLSTSG